MSLNFGNKQDNQGSLPTGRLTANEFNELVQLVNNNETSIETIKKSMVKVNISDNEDFNDIVKELYFNGWCNVGGIKTIAIKRNGSSTELSGLWELYLIDTSGNSHWMSFGSDAEKQDVNTAQVGWSSSATSTIFNEDNRGKIYAYAVIDWDKVTNQNGSTNSDNFIDIKINSRVNNLKFFPQINACLQNCRYTHNSLANNVIKELYFENLCKFNPNTGELEKISEYDFKQEFRLERIDRATTSENNATPTWSIVFSGQYNGESVHFFISTTVSPEVDLVWTQETSSWIKNDEGDSIRCYQGTIHAIIDWGAIGYGKQVLLRNTSLLGRCLHRGCSLMIHHYLADKFNVNHFGGEVYLKIEGYPTQYSLWNQFSNSTFSNEFRTNYAGGALGSVWRVKGHSGGILVSSWAKLFLITSSSYVVFEYTDENGNRTDATDGGYWRKFTEYKHITTDERAKWDKVVTDFSAFIATEEDSDEIINRWQEVKNFLSEFKDTGKLKEELDNLKNSLQSNTAIEGEDLVLNENKNVVIDDTLILLQPASVYKNTLIL